MTSRSNDSSPGEEAKDIITSFDLTVEGLAGIRCSQFSAMCLG
jgi:hypothetical protein